MRADAKFHRVLSRWDFHWMYGFFALAVLLLLAHDADLHLGGYAIGGFALAGAGMIADACRLRRACPAVGQVLAGALIAGFGVFGRQLAGERPGIETILLAGFCMVMSAASAVGMVRNTRRAAFMVARMQVDSKA